MIDPRAHAEKDAPFLASTALAGDYLYKIVIRHLFDEITGRGGCRQWLPGLLSDAETGRYWSLCRRPRRQVGDKSWSSVAGVLRRIREWWKPTVKPGS